GLNKIHKAVFKKHGDFEDITICQNTVVMLRSDGKLYGMPLTQVRRAEIDSVAEWNKVLPKGEYEGIYADNASSKIYVLYKTHPKPDEHKHTSGFVFQMQDGILQPAGEFQISVSQIEEKSGKHNINFKPSAMAQ